MSVDDQIGSVGDARILIVDDEPANVLLLSEVLGDAGYTNVEGECDPRRGLDRFASRRPDLLLLDLHMPHLDGFAVMEAARAFVPRHEFVPIVILTADIRFEVRERALRLGAEDFLTKPFVITEVLLRIRNLLRTRLLHREVQRQNLLLEERVVERTRAFQEAHAQVVRFAGDLGRAQIEILDRLALAAEYRDDDTGRHVQRVSRNSALLARTLGLPDEQADLIRRGSTLHDVGKIGIPDSVLLKPGKLSPDEFNLIKGHTSIGARILSGSDSPLLQTAEEIAFSHHEKWDGSGYHCLRGEDIPLAGRIVAVADVFDALTHQRPYKKAWSHTRAVAEIQSQSGRHFDPSVVFAFLQLDHQQMIQ